MAKLLDPAETPFLRPAQVAAVLGVNLKTVLNGIHDEAIPCTKLGRAFLVPTAWVVRQAQQEERTEAAS
jgi:excisionase family DNA binding protein